MDQSAIELVAKTMIWLFEADAIPELRRRAASALDTGNTEEFEGWQKILQAVRLLQLPIAAE